MTNRPHHRALLIAALSLLALALVSGGWLLPVPRALFDNSPLRALLKREVPWRGVGLSLRSGQLDALALCCTGYGTARSVAFFEGREGHNEWSQYRHVGRRVRAVTDEVKWAKFIPPTALVKSEVDAEMSGSVLQSGPTARLSAGQLRATWNNLSARIKKAVIK